MRVAGWRWSMRSPALQTILIATLAGTVTPNPDAKRLYDDLLSNYNRLIR